MVHFACVFPGQGSQSVGMLSEWLGQNTLVRQTFEEASDALGYDLIALVQEGPAERLNQTEYTQPALLASGVAVWRVLQSQLQREPQFVAGHSLGEYTALVCAKSLSFTDALKSVQMRGRLMQQAVSPTEGAMAAILGGDEEVIVRICVEVSGSQTVSAANFNAHGQTVIAGHREAVERAITALQAEGVKRAILLPVSVPSHCALMKPAADALQPILEALDWGIPSFPVIHNVDVASHQEMGAIIRCLVTQLFSPVRWVETVEYLSRQHVGLLLECGPGKVLCGLNKRIDANMQALPIFDDATLEAAVLAIEAI